MNVLNWLAAVAMWVIAAFLLAYYITTYLPHI